MVIEPFEKWALDFVGPTNPPSSQNSYTLVCTNHVKKWLKAKVLTRSNKKVVSTLLVGGHLCLLWGNERVDATKWC